MGLPGSGNRDPFSLKEFLSTVWPLPLSQWGKSCSIYNKILALNTGADLMPEFELLPQQEKFLLSSSPAVGQGEIGPFTVWLLGLYSYLPASKWFFGVLSFFFLSGNGILTGTKYNSTSFFFYQISPPQALANTWEICFCIWKTAPS